ncbi:Fcf2 pre-rRNA processing-domain-containing protein, partial [Pisolithus tinctorius]|uniref:Fcf2 pre-rRNA processing C-terminal domain-containing protein n=1 Tax=Pisolithus tinctorius Marx 270 TaxID=870435 RepID=A0A0C3NZC2_PISTI
MAIIDKGKQRATEDPIGVRVDHSDEDSETSSAVSDTDSESEPEEITQEYLNSLLEKAKQNAREEARLAKMLQEEKWHEQDVIKIQGEEEQRPLPPLDPGKLPPAYFEFGEGRHEAPSTVRDPDVAQTEAASAAAAVPAPPPEPKPVGLTKRQMKAAKQKTAGPDWFGLPAPAEADLPRLYREVEALRLRNQLDPKRFYRKDEGEGKGIKGLPKHFAIGTIVTTTTPFGTASSDNLRRAERKRTLVDELVDDAEARRYAKKKFGELQDVRGAAGRNTLRQKRALRQRKW